MPGLLEGLRVLDLSDEKGKLCGKILADLGAEVILLEKPGLKIADCYGNLGKHAISLDLDSACGQNLLLQMVKRFDVLVESLNPGYLDSVGLSFERLSHQNHGLIMVSISAYGQKGPYRHFRSSELVSAAMGGQVYLNGVPGRHPIQPPVSLVSSLACLNAVFGVLVATRQKRSTGVGQYLDISLQECSVDALDHALVRYFYLDQVAERSGDFNWNGSMRVFPCSDGYILISLLYQWETLVGWLDSENMAGDLTNKVYLDERERLKNLDHVVSVIEKWTMRHKVDELVETGQAMHFPWGRVSSLQQLVGNVQLRERGFFLQLKDAEGKEYLIPGPPVKMKDSLWQVKSEVPEAGSFNSEIYKNRMGLRVEEIEQLTKDGVI